MPDEFLTVREIAELLKLNQQTVRNMIDRGELGHDCSVMPRRPTSTARPAIAVLVLGASLKYG
jgi:hypothetical protein